MDPQHICNKEQQQNMLAAVLWVCAKAQASHIYKLEILLQLKQTSEAQIRDKNLYLKKLIFKKNSATWPWVLTQWGRARLSGVQGHPQLEWVQGQPGGGEEKEEWTLTTRRREEKQRVTLILSKSCQNSRMWQRSYLVPKGESLGHFTLLRRFSDFWIWFY